MNLKKLIDNKFLTLNMVLIVSIVASLFAWKLIPIEVFPQENTPPFLFVRVNAIENKSSEIQENSITKICEGVVKTLPGLVSMQSNTDPGGVSLSLKFKPGSDLDDLTFTLTQSLQEHEGQGLYNMKGVAFSRMNPEAQAVIKISVKSENLKILSQLKDDLRLKIEALQDVSKIEWIGLDPPQHQFTIKENTLKLHDISPQTLHTQMKLSNYVESLGIIHIGNKEVSTSIEEKSEDISILKKIPLKPSTSVYLGDISKNQILTKENSEILHLNGQPSVFLEIYAKEGANFFRLKNDLRDLMESFPNDNKLKQINVEIISDRIEDLETALQDVFSSLYQALLITFFVVWFFLKDLRRTLIISSTIPLTLIITILFLYVRGTSLNLLTLSGLILCIGMVVDNAILIIDRLIEIPSGKNAKQEAGQAADDVSAALIISSITNALIFVPVVFIESDDQFILILKSFIGPILASLLASIFIALIYAPVVSVWCSLKQKMSAEHLIDKFEIRSKSVFQKIYQFRSLSILVTFFITLIAIDCIKNIGSIDMTDGKDPFIGITVRFEKNIPRENKKHIFSEIEKYFLSNEKSLNLRAILGEYNPISSSGQLSFFPIKTGDSDEDLNQLKIRITRIIHSAPVKPGVSVTFSDEFSFTATGYQIRSWSIMGTSQIAVRKLLEPMVETFRQSKSIVKAEIGKPVVANFDHILNIKPSAQGSPIWNEGQIQASLSSLLMPIFFPSIKSDGEEISAKIEIEPEQGSFQLRDAAKILLQAEKNSTTLDSLVDFHEAPTILNPSRKNGVNQTQLQVMFDKDATAEEKSMVENKVKSFAYPLGFGLPEDDSQKKIEEMKKNTNFIIFLSIFLIYIFLASQFESIFIPFAIMTTVPLSLIFGLFGLWLTGYELDIMARLSLVLLVGVGVNNSIILIDYILSLRNEGYSRKEAIVLGCSRRLRAVVMTTTIQILSVLPVALGDAKLMGIPYKTLGIVMISGMLFSTLVTLLILPALYIFFDNFSNAKQ